MNKFENKGRERNKGKCEQLGNSSISYFCAQNTQVRPPEKYPLFSHELYQNFASISVQIPPYRIS